MIQKNLFALIFISKCFLKRFQTERNAYSLKRYLVIDFNKNKSNYTSLLGPGQLTQFIDKEKKQSELIPGRKIFINTS